MESKIVVFVLAEAVSSGTITIAIAGYEVDTFFLFDFGRSSNEYTFSVSGDLWWCSYM